MSTPTRPRRHLGTHRARVRHTGPGETPFWDRHHWTVPALAVGAVVGAFLMMIVLTALAGGSTPFTG
ncbi:hypothetical protein [Modestobacter sp. I12A-02662]|uniref:hypothetical protein n=1 Tax=Modestobacter sp. I12A-02662 TaxID=1730496 RepID=UPI0034DE8F23